MINTKALSSAAVLGMVALLFVGCGDGDNSKTQICMPAAATCDVDGNKGSVCSADGTSLIEFSCEKGEVCRAGACVAKCTVGEVTCAGKAVSRICSEEGNQWEPVPCPAGTACKEGDGCVPSDEGVTICKPKESVCANETTVKTCDADGSGWVYTECPEGVACTDGECSFKAKTSCTPRAKACVDGDTSAVCKDDGKGWTITDCPKGTACVDGACRGSGCVVGETRCDEPDALSIIASFGYYTSPVDFRTVYTCVDGVHWEATPCAPGTICTYDNVPAAEIERFANDLGSWYLSFYGGGELAVFGSFPKLPDTSNSVASCQAPECDLPANQLILAQLGYFGDVSSLGEQLVQAKVAQCGDATNSKVDPTSAYSVCTGLPPYSNLQWSVTQCQAPASCTFNGELGLLTDIYKCATECTPGELRCADTDAIQECQEDGTWGEPKSCGLIEYDGKPAYSGVCVTSGLIQGVTQARCVDPVCAAWMNFEDTFLPPGVEPGACIAGRFRRCNSKGLLDKAEDCAGTCVPASSGGPPTNSAGQYPGLCIPECVEGEARCLSDDALQTCKDGKWSLDPEVCAAGQSCYDYEDVAGARKAVCGECVPGTSECDGNTLITCSSTGKLTQQVCSNGYCMEGGAFAYCEADCLEGTKICGGDGDTAYYECVNGKYVEKSCGAGTSCRVSAQGKHFACVECLGPNTGGNSYGVVDSYCSADGNLVRCGNNNRYGSPTTCDAACTSNLSPSNEKPLSPVYAYCSPEVKL